MIVWGRRVFEPDCAREAERLFGSFLVLSVGCGLVALYGAEPPNPSVHWPGHGWIHFMKRVHVIMSIGCFLIEVCATFFSLFALHRVLAGGFDTHATSTAALLMRELEFEYVAVCSYSFAGAWLLMGPVAIRCFCQVQQGLRSDTLAAAVCCLIVGTFLLVLSFFNAHLVAFPYETYDGIIHRFVQLSLTRCQDGGRPAVITALAWTLQAVSVFLAMLSLVETFPWNYYRDLDRGSAVAFAQADARNAAARARADGDANARSPAPDDLDGMSDVNSDAVDRPLRGVTPTHGISGNVAAHAPAPVASGGQTSRGGVGATLVSAALQHASAAARPHPSGGFPGGAPAAGARWGFQPTRALAGSPPPPPSCTSLAEGDDEAAGTSCAVPPTTSGVVAFAPSVALAQAAQPPWSLALAQVEPRTLAQQQQQQQPPQGGGLAMPTGAGGHLPSALANPDNRTRRRGSGGNCSKVSSVASSMFSLDSNVVD